MIGVLGAVTTISGLTANGSVPGFPAGSSASASQNIVNSGGSGFVGSALGLSSLAGALVELVAVVAMTALVGILIIAVVANRADPDPTGRRPQSVYFFVVSFVTITTAIAGSALIVGAILWLTANHSSSANNGIDRLLLVSILITLVSLALLTLHIRRGLLLARADNSSLSPSRRVGQSYVSVVAFVSILVLLVASIVSIYLVFSIAAPGTFGSFGGRGSAARILVESVYLAAVAVFVIWRHSSLVTPGLGIFSNKVSDPGALGAARIGEPPTTQLPG